MNNTKFRLNTEMALSNNISKAIDTSTFETME